MSNYKLITKHAAEIGRWVAFIFIICLIGYGLVKPGLTDVDSKRKYIEEKSVNCTKVVNESLIAGQLLKTVQCADGKTYTY